MIHYQKDADNIATLTLDMQAQSVNVINHRAVESLRPVLEHLRSEAAQRRLAGVIITSAKRSFSAGGDLDYLHNAESAEQIFAYSRTLNEILRGIELLPVPVVAAINGAALGSGYELALACHYRIALDTPNTLIGLPEVSLGMIPGGGSLVRLAWSLGIEAAFELTSRGKQYHVQEALRKGLIDKVVSERRELLEEAREYIRSRPDIVKLWDKGIEPPRLCNPRHPYTAQLIADLNAQVYARTRGNYPAQQAIVNALYECMQVSFEQALNIVSRHFTRVILDRTCRNMTKAFWYDYNRIRNGAPRPKGYGRFRARRIGVIGAGDMGAGIAFLAATEGIEVVIKDISLAIAQQGKNMCFRLVEDLVSSDKLSRTQGNEILARIQPTDKASDFEHCDLVIEAVFENAELKARIAREAELYMPRDAFFASNSASLSINELAASFSRPPVYIGMHFFAPIQHTKLVEIVYGKQTNQETIARAFDFVQHIGKVPILVRDGNGFFVMRVVRNYIMEGLLLLSEGQHPAYIRNCALLAGMGQGPLVLADQVSLRAVYENELRQRAISGELYAAYTPAFDIVEAMIKQHQRYGKSAKAGFYEYSASGERGQMWAELAQFFPLQAPALPKDDVADRLLFVQILEAARALEEGVIGSSGEANLGSIYGWGFPAARGGVLQFINDYGVQEFVERCDELRERYGERFATPDSVRQMQSQQLNFA